MFSAKITHQDDVGSAEHLVLEADTIEQLGEALLKGATDKGWYTPPPAEEHESKDESKDESKAKESDDDGDVVHAKASAEKSGVTRRG